MCHTIPDLWLIVHSKQTTIASASDFIILVPACNKES